MRCAPCQGAPTSMYSISLGLIEAGPSPSVPKGLSAIERDVLDALSDEYVSTTVIKCRARLPINQRNGPTLQACIDLRSRGLAESIGSGLSLRWRRRTADDASIAPEGGGIDR